MPGVAERVIHWVRRSSRAGVQPLLFVKPVVMTADGVLWGKQSRTFASAASGHGACGDCDHAGGIWLHRCT
jgi:hypothetical protein